MIINEEGCKRKKRNVECFFKCAVRKLENKKKKLRNKKWWMLLLLLLSFAIVVCVCVCIGAISWDYINKNCCAAYYWKTTLAFLCDAVNPQRTQHRTQQKKNISKSVIKFNDFLCYCCCWLKWWKHTYDMVLLTIDIFRL